ncbi:MAG: hypothetical protein U9R58_12000 [Chloroflexota bacterium]|nr:hypothetical protein [Chloroflexota bacterium]
MSSYYAEWVKFTISEMPELANYYEERFRQEFRPAFDAWGAAVGQYNVLTFPIA